MKNKQSFSLVRSNSGFIRDRKVGLAIISGILACLLIILYLVDRNKSIRQKSSLTEVVITVKNIESGVRIEDDMLEIKKIPAEFIQPGCLHSKKEVIGQISLIPLAAGEQILANKIAKTGTSITSAISIGKRGVTISVDRVSGMIALIQPGDYVDVLATVDGPEGRTYTATVLQNVRVIAVAENFIRGEKKKSNFNEELIGNLSDTVTLSLSPSEAEVIAFAENRGKLKLVLRAVGDNEAVYTSSTSFNNLLKSSLQPKKAELPSIEIIRGTKGEIVPMKKE